jgi:hypothetical protein
MSKPIRDKLLSWLPSSSTKDRECVPTSEKLLPEDITADLLNVYREISRSEASIKFVEEKLVAMRAELTTLRMRRTTLEHKLLDTVAAVARKSS